MVVALPIVLIPSCEPVCTYKIFKNHLNYSLDLFPKQEIIDNR